MRAAFRRGDWFEGPGPVRASAVRELLLAGAAAEAERLLRLRLRGVTITGTLDLAETVVAGTLRLHDCRLEQAPCLDGASLGALELQGCELPGVSAAGLTTGWKCEISGCHVTGPIDLYSASIGGSLHLENSRLTGRGERRGEAALQLLCATVGGDIQAGTGLCVDGCTDLRDTSVRGTVVLKRARLINPDGKALNAKRLHVGGDLNCRGGLVAEGTVDLRDAQVGGGVLFEAASITSGSGPAVWAHGMTVGAEFNCCDGFTAHGRVSISSVTVRSRICFQDAVVDVPPGKPAITCCRSTASEFALAPREAIRGTVDLSHTRLTLLRGVPDAWPEATRLEGVVYDSLLPRLPAAQRLPLLAKDPEGFTPQPYEQLAAVYRLHGHDADARTVLLAQQRHRRTTLAWPGRVWSGIQDLTVGYGYRPLRAVWWLCAIMLSGILVFTRWPPQAIEPGKSPQFQAAIYTFDLVLPLVDFGQEAAFRPRGGLQWAAVVLVCLGWLLATTAAAGANRMLRRS
ncbi:oxidoreductase [Streptomyces aureus]|uniref:oxidoreductase n=1 Tax=Streptomyces aureus TaxID=193461 RepID=UPI00341175AB